MLRNNIEYWLRTAKDDLVTAQIIFDAGKNYHHCLFFCHLIMEKGLKALVVKQTKDVPPKIHNLLMLSKLAKLELTKEQQIFIAEVNTFNIEGRYPDEK